GGGEVARRRRRGASLGQHAVPEYADCHGGQRAQPGRIHAHAANRGIWNRERTTDGRAAGCESGDQGLARVLSYFPSRINVGTMPAAEENPDLPDESQLEQPCTLPR